ncbi:outer membrane beta-barrel protein [Thalassotalea agarivorans]|uniref:Outer membrane protein beta-barrel domain-containing protein n=1 Tax=Thalassotalea agarivorans TaxID=349064 RepID=A0A1I0GLP6_THASX|nr:outer membrane beta-barrel protein [Thalassotalea agarivorans]SET71917.1 Outer membrane protein beta-barrel domain-containing protein [Thalassotalea agarivorans]
MKMSKWGTIVGSILLFWITTTQALANESIRSGKWEGSFQIIGADDQFIESYEGSTLEIKDDLGWGFTLGYNFNPHVAVNFEMVATRPTYKANLIDDNGNEVPEIHHKADIWHSQFNLVYNVFSTKFTPYVQAGVGWTYIDSNIASAPPEGVCWWDPWWGWICDTYQATYNDSRFSYNGAVGLKYEFDNYSFVRAGVGMNFVSTNSGEDLDLTVVKLEIGSLF